MIRHSDISASDLRSKIRKREIRWGGNRQLKIYGTLSCASGKKMKGKPGFLFNRRGSFAK